MALELAPARVEVVRRPDGTILLRSPIPLREPARTVTEWLVSWAERTPDATFLAERQSGGDFVPWSYSAMLEAVRATAGQLLDLGASEARPLMLLSDNSVDHAILSLAAQHVGIPAVPISAAYSLMSRDHAKLRAIAELVEPAVIFADDPVRYGPALAAIAFANARVVVSKDPADDALELSSLRQSHVDARVEEANSAIGPGTIAKILFTSGSTGEPKGVINTHRMLTSNQEAIAQLWPFLEARPPRLVDWLPWNHTFGGNHNFNMVLRNGGTLYINAGKPAPALVGETVRNLREISPTIYFDVPRGFDVLLPFLEEDEALRTRFFAELDLVFYAGAALPQSLWDRMEAVSKRARAKAIPMVSAWGSTETSPLVTSVHFAIPRAGVIGLPAPGCEVKLVPNADKLEMRVRGPNVTPGYLKRPDLTEAAFDDEGFYRIGDAGRFEDEQNPEKGLVFDGRVSEDFKLTTGTWVHVGTLRVELIAACTPVVSDAVITGHDRDEVGALLFLNSAACAAMDRPAIATAIVEGLRALGAKGRGSSQRVTRALVLDEPASIDAGEITDKGYLNQRRILERRAELVDALHRGGPGVLQPS